MEEQKKEEQKKEEQKKKDIQRLIALQDRIYNSKIFTKVHIQSAAKKEEEVVELQKLKASLNGYSKLTLQQMKNKFKQDFPAKVKVEAPSSVIEKIIAAYDAKYKKDGRYLNGYGMQPLAEKNINAESEGESEEDDKQEDSQNSTVTLFFPENEGQDGSGHSTEALSFFKKQADSKPYKAFIVRDEKDNILVQTNGRDGRLMDKDGKLYTQKFINFNPPEEFKIAKFREALHDNRYLENKKRNANSNKEFREGDNDNKNKAPGQEA